MINLILYHCVAGFLQSEQLKNAAELQLGQFFSSKGNDI